MRGTRGSPRTPHCWCPLSTPSSAPPWDRSHPGSRPEGAATRGAPSRLAGQVPSLPHAHRCARRPRRTYRRRVDAQLPRQEEERLPQHVHVHLPGEAHAGAVCAALHGPVQDPAGPPRPAAHTMVSSSPSWLWRGLDTMQALPGDPCLPGAPSPQPAWPVGPWAKAQETSKKDTQEKSRPRCVPRPPWGAEE